jgi:hypothetical protein
VLTHLDPSATLLPTRGKGVGFASRRMTKWGRGITIRLVCLLRKRFLDVARNDGRAVGTNVKKPLSQCSGTDSSPLGGGAENKVDLISQRFALPAVSNGVRSTPFSGTVRACICAHSSRTAQTAHCAVWIMRHSSHFVKEGCAVLTHLDPSATLLPTRGKGVGFASRRMTR